MGWVRSSSNVQALPSSKGGTKTWFSQGTGRMKGFDHHQVFSQIIIHLFIYIIYFLLVVNMYSHDMLVHTYI